MRVKFDEYTDIIPQACGNCRYYEGNYCAADWDSTEEPEKKEPMDVCPFFEWEG